MDIQSANLKSKQNALIVHNLVDRLLLRERVLASSPITCQLPLANIREGEEVELFDNLALNLAIDELTLLVVGRHIDIQGRMKQADNLGLFSVIAVS